MKVFNILQYIYDEQLVQIKNSSNMSTSPIFPCYHPAIQLARDYTLLGIATKTTKEGESYLVIMCAS